ncbi:hypothetical protein RJ45_08785 [Photobacterium gaetbulicola]|uniref:Uncharacterized protein n=1 Tax=Photobacterium gaetbulicola TaxID=1295392 RepID=A0A0B9G5H9_9GAMM|nr:hypothetical protein RJ45_08785 [Photobacterium gaetbulicola]
MVCICYFMLSMQDCILSMVFMLVTGEVHSKKRCFMHFKVNNNKINNLCFNMRLSVMVIANKYVICLVGIAKCLVINIMM